MIEPSWYLLGLGLPMVIAAALAWALVRNKDARPGGLPAVGWSIGIGLAMLIGLLATTGLPPWKSIQSQHWLVMAVLPAALFVALIGSISKTPKAMLWLLRVLVAAGIAPVLMQPMVHYTWDAGEAVVWLGGLGAAVLTVWVLMHLYTVRYGGRAPLFVLGATAAGVAVCTFASGSITSGQLTGSFAVALGGVWLATASGKTCTHAGPGLTDIAVPLLLGLLINSWAYSWQMQHEPLASRVVAGLLLAAPLGLWVGRVSLFKRLPSVNQALVGCGVSALGIVSAIGIAGYEAYLRS
ncbi:MAG: hypothetical protein IID40_09285 [Planctomycetes bacterium]|nr:hypothetical protein [Planctomycetota bacterium]